MKLQRHPFIMAGAVALGLLALSGGARAQGMERTKTDSFVHKPAEADGTPLAGLDDAQIAQFLEEFSRSREVAALVEQLEAELLKPGEKVPGWQSSGIDIIAELAAREGGLAGNLLRDVTGETPGITDFSGTARPDLPGFATLAVRPPPPGANERSFTSFSPGIWLALDFERTARGNAACYGSRVGVTIHSRAPFAQWDEMTAFTAAALIAGLDRMTEREFCLVYAREGDGSSIRGYRPDGRRLTQLDDPVTAYRIMPAGELSAHMHSAVPIMSEAEPQP